MKVYGSPICIDCRNWSYICEQRGLTIEYINITEDTSKLKEFLAIRDTAEIYGEVRARGGIGIPYFVDGEKSTFDWDEALAWIGQEPVKEEEIREHRPVCDSCG